MKEPFFAWLESLGLELTPTLSTVIIFAVIILTSLIVHLILHRVILQLIEKQAAASDSWWHIALNKHHLFRRLALTLQGIILFAQARIWLEPGSQSLPFIEVITHLWILLFGLLTLFSLLDATREIALRSEKGKSLPLGGLFQGIKIIASALVIILMLALIIGKSPLLLFSGLGAMTAVLMLVFKDPILGFVAGIQLSANKMLAVGDWLEMPKYGADGDVFDISLTTVKVRNWDKTITTVPTYALISDSFKNWRGMQETGGRRIKRSVFIDATSVRFLDKDDLARLREKRLLTEYIEKKLAEITADNRARGLDEFNGRRLTNLGTFRAYLVEYLKANDKIHNGLTQIVRQLASGAEGIPLEIYAFTNDTAWVAYEGIQSDLFDHIFAVLPEFGLRVFQSPTGYDMRDMITGLRKASQVSSASAAAE